MLLWRASSSLFFVHSLIQRTAFSQLALRLSLLGDMAVWSKSPFFLQGGELRVPCPSPASVPCSQHSLWVTHPHYSLEQKTNLVIFCQATDKNCAPEEPKRCQLREGEGGKDHTPSWAQTTPAQKEPPAPAVFWQALLGFKSHITPEKSFYKKWLPVFKLPEFDSFTALQQHHFI